MKVDVFILRQEKPVLAGSIHSDNGLSYSPQDSEILKKICETPIRVSQTKIISPEEGDTFLEALSIQYRSPYLRVSEPY